MTEAAGETILILVSIPEALGFQIVVADLGLLIGYNKNNEVIETSVLT